jgi:hypothetical protein
MKYNPDSQYVKVKGKSGWHQVINVKDTGIPAHIKNGGNNYTLKDHEGNSHTVNQSEVHEHTFGDDLEEAKKSDSKKELITEHHRLVDVLKHGSNKEQVKEGNVQAKELKGLEKEELVIKSNGQWELNKSNYGPKNANLYEAHVNQNRKSNNTNDQVADAGKNVNVKAYTSAKEGTAKDQANMLATKQAKLNAKQPIKTQIPADLKAELEARANKTKG